MKKNKNLSSFTLLEMLIVIGIIAVILSLVAVSYSNAQKKARDSRRKSDLKTIQSSLEQYYSICGFQYPDMTGSGSNIIPTIGCVSPSTIIMPTRPVDPRTITPYLMLTGLPGAYQVCADMESESPTRYCVVNQQ